MTDEQTDNFDWGELGEQWWRTTGAECKASELQIKFTCARHAGATKTGAARLAGYTDNKTDSSAIRQAGHKAAASTAVLNMLALAEAEAKPTAPRILDKAGRLQLLSDLATKSQDPTLKIRAVEGMNRMAERDIELGASMEQDGHGDDRLAREYLTWPNGAMAFIAVWRGADKALNALPLFWDCYNKIQQEAPAIWDWFLAKTHPNDRAQVTRLLTKPDWQMATRVKIWREIGRDIDPQNRVDLSVLTTVAGGSGAANGHDTQQQETA